MKHSLHVDYAYKYGKHEKDESNQSSSLKATAFTVTWNNGSILLKVKEVSVKKKNRTVGLHSVTVLSKFYSSLKKHNFTNMWFLENALVSSSFVFNYF